jgi:predicted metal-dependent hydrolase
MTALLRERRPRLFTLDGETIAVRVRESERAHTSRIIVGPRRPLEVIVPRGTTLAKIDELLESRRRWIEVKIARSREIAERPPRLGLQRADAVWLTGEPLPVERRNGRRSLAKLEGNRLVVLGPDAEVRAAIERWYRRRARPVIAEVVAREADRLGLRYRSIAIRDQRTRWGSCSHTGTLSFSWRLLVAPREVLEYIVAHELCHLKVPGHGKPFWRLLESVRPGWQEQARWLREHGAELHAYVPAAAAPER